MCLVITAMGEDPEPGIPVTIMGAAIVVSDYLYRRKNKLKAFNAQKSSLFFFIPTWVIGAPFLLLGLILTLQQAGQDSEGYYLNSNKNAVTSTAQMSFANYTEYVNACIAHIYLDSWGKVRPEYIEHSQIESYLSTMEKERVHPIEKITYAWFLVKEKSFNKNTDEALNVDKKLLEYVQEIEKAAGSDEAKDKYRKLEQQHLECLIWEKNVKSYLDKKIYKNEFITALLDKKKGDLQKVINKYFLPVSEEDKDKALSEMTNAEINEVTENFSYGLGSWRDMGYISFAPKDTEILIEDVLKSELE